MKRKSILLFYALLISFALAHTSTSLRAQNNKAPLSETAIAALKAKVESTPDSLRAHQEYIKGIGTENPQLEIQYQTWMEKYPTSAIVPYALGEAYKNMESPKAKPYLLKAVAINPKFAEAWAALSIDGERWGNFEEARKYMGNAAASAPENPNYAFYYASSFDSADPAKYVKMSLDVAKRFPTHERGAQALYWLGARSKKNSDKLKFYEQLYKSYAPSKFSWSSSGMTSYFDVLLKENPKKAVALAAELAKDKKSEKEWSGLLLQAKTVAEAKTQMDAKNTTAALASLKKVKLPRYFSFNKEIVLLRAKAIDLSGNTSAAYDSLIVSFAKNPSVTLKSAINSYGKKLDKNTAQVDADIWARLDLIAKAATPFTLKRYLIPGESSLEDYKGKVMLLTYWFPGCGPCRGEFPHFENVVRKFKGKDLEYVGINIVSDQNDYVVPFMKSSGYSFTPLEDVKGRNKGNLDNGGAAPTNFLIDKQGRIIFSNFRTDGDNEDDLELMIGMLLSNQKTTGNENN